MKVTTENENSMNVFIVGSATSRTDSFLSLWVRCTQAECLSDRCRGALTHKPNRQVLSYANLLNLPGFDLAERRM